MVADCDAHFLSDIDDSNTEGFGYTLVFIANPPFATHIITQSEFCTCNSAP